jgi:hypothetical protein
MFALLIFVDRVAETAILNSDDTDKPLPAASLSISPARARLEAELFGAVVVGEAGWHGQQGIETGASGGNRNTAQSDRAEQHKGLKGSIIRVGRLERVKGIEPSS